MPALLAISVLLLCAGRAVTGETPKDWLIHTPADFPAPTLTDDGRGNLVFSNGLISRTFATEPAWGTVDFRNHLEPTPLSMLRSVMEEARVMLDTTPYAVGGLALAGGAPHAYLVHPLNLTADPSAFHFLSYRTSAPTAPYPWTPGARGSPQDASWPPRGLHLAVTFAAPATAPPQHRCVSLTLHYELYTGAPTMAKWLTTATSSACAPTPPTLRHVSVELLGLNRPFSPVTLAPGDRSGRLSVRTSLPHSTAVLWQNDPALPATPGAREPVLNVTYEAGPGTATPAFESFRVLLTALDSDDAERRGLAERRVTRLLAPQTLENPIFFHLTDASPAGFRRAVDQMAAVGFEMVIYSFGSGFKLETLNETYLAQVAADVVYARARGIEVGGYDLIVLDRGHGGYGGNVGDAMDVVGADGELTQDACLASAWLDKLSHFTFTFVNRTGLSMLETDGPYGGATCHSTAHPHHRDADDSVYEQTMAQARYYRELRARGLYVNQPDGYFFAGAQKAPMGYSEQSFSLPRWQDLNVNRQGLFDDTFHYVPTQGWMFVPLVQYHGGGAAATFEPLAENLADYEWALAQYLSSGVAACYRGYRLFDTPATKAVVRKWVRFYKQYRDILTSDIIHVRRPDLQSIDCMMHVNVELRNRALATVFNPTASVVEALPLRLPLYYTGIQRRARVFPEGAGEGEVFALDRDFSIDLPVTMQPRTITWFLIQSADD